MGNVENKQALPRKGSRSRHKVSADLDPKGAPNKMQQDVTSSKERSDDRELKSKGSVKVEHTNVGQVKAQQSVGGSSREMEEAAETCPQGATSTWRRPGSADSPGQAPMALPASQDDDAKPKLDPNNHSELLEQGSASENWTKVARLSTRKETVDTKPVLPPGGAKSIYNGPLSMKAPFRAHPFLRGHVRGAIAGREYCFLRPIIREGSVDVAEGQSEAGVSASARAQRDVYLKVGNAELGRMPLQDGDLMEYLQMERSDRVFATFARLVRCSARAPAVLESYTSSLTSAAADTPADVLRDVTRCPAGLLALLHVPAPSSRSTRGLLRLVERVTCFEGDRELHSTRRKQLLDLVTGSPFVTCPELVRFAKTAIGEETRKDLELIQNFISTLVSNDRNSLPRIAHILPEIAVHSPANTCPGVAFLLNVVSSAVGSSYRGANTPWHHLPLLPSPEELRSETFGSDPALPFVVKEGRYPSAEDYLDTYFRLLREDCFESLRTGIEDLRQSRLDERDMRVYDRVKVVGVHFMRGSPGVAFALSFKTRGKAPDWAHSSALMTGSLLCLFSEEDRVLQHPVWAIVANRSLQNLAQGVIFAEILDNPYTGASESPHLVSVLHSEAMTMVESPTYYRAYRPVLQALQHMDPERLPFQQELVNVDSTLRPPAYICEATTFDWSIILDPSDAPEDKPTRGPLAHMRALLKDGYTTSLDESQLKAAELALSSRLGLIQGPPGTGKTFVGTKIVKLLLSASTLPQGPILMVTYKNHELDSSLESFLEVLEDPGELIRVGSRSDSESLRAHNLHAFLGPGGRDGFTGDYKEDRRQLEELRFELEDALDNLVRSRVFSPETFVEQSSDLQLRALLERARPHEQLLSALPPDITLRSLLSETDTTAPAVLKAKLLGAVKDAVSAWLPKAEAFATAESILGPEQTVPLETPVSPRKSSRTERGDADSDDEKDRNAFEEMRTGTTAPMGADWLRNDFLELERCTEGSVGLSNGRIDLSHHEWLLGTDPWSLQPVQRALLVHLLQRRHVAAAQLRYVEVKAGYESACADLDDIAKARKVEVLRKAKVIGMTTTGAAMHADVLSAVSPAVILVEEAAEILEPQILAVLHPKAQHLIQIGDHKQLRPQVQSYTLDHKHGFAISMFERLASLNGFPCQTLNLQCRMRPEFVPMLLPTYPDLQSHVGLVCGARNCAPTCVKTSSFFWAHSHPELTQRSYANPGEAEMAVRLAAWFVAEGHPQETITILAPYNGQVALIRQKAASNPDTSSTRVSTVDRYQGEENSIVIVSFTRSNQEGRIGHVALPNRLCVAASRARCGVYFLGNPKALSKNAECWKTLIAYLKSQNLIGPEIPLVCPRHPAEPPLLIHSDRPSKLKARKLCSKRCQETLRCGHSCAGGCHCGAHLLCREEVAFTFDTCGHPGVRLCSAPRGQCQKRVPFQFEACGHSAECECWQKETATLTGKSTLRCKVPCTRLLEACKHPCPLDCGDDCASATCQPCDEIEREKRRKEQAAARRQRAQMRRHVREEIEKLKAINVEEGYVLKKLHPRGETAAKYFEVKDRTEMYLQEDPKTLPVVESVEEVINLPLQLQWLEAQRDLFDPTQKSLLFHGINKKGVHAICGEGFKLPEGGGRNMFGQGCYFAPDSSKSAQHCGDDDTLILCEVLLGRSWTVETAQSAMNLEKIRKKGFDSLYSKRDAKSTGGTRFDEFVIYDPRQAIPRFVVHFKKLGIHDPSIAQLAAEAAALQSRRTARIPLSPQRNYAGGTSEDYHFRTAESQFYRMSSDRSLKVTLVEYVVNPALQERYESTKAALKSRLNSNPDELLLFHGTDKAAIDRIVAEGFKIGGKDVPIKCGAMYGQGVYTAEDPAISVSFSGGSKMMLLALGLPGRQGEDWKSGGSQHVVVIQSSEQLLPRYVVHFSR